MNNVIAIIPAADFAFMARFASTEEARYYICGVSIEHNVANAAGERFPGLTMASTDGYRAGVMRLDDSEGYLAPDAKPLILRATKDLLKACKPSSRYSQRVLILRPDRIDIVEHTVKNPQPTDLADLPPVGSIFTASGGLYIDGTFPDWRRIIPRTDTDDFGQRRIKDGRWAGFNPAYLAAFAHPTDKKNNPW